MTTSDLAEIVAAELDFSSQEGRLVVTALVNGLIDTLRKGERVQIRGFGSFRPHQRRSRTVRHPRTGAEILVPAKSVPRFVPSRRLREALLRLPASPSR